jgi:hypothetical protein
MPRYVCAQHTERAENGPCIYCEYDETFLVLKGAREMLDATNKELDDALTSNRIKTENLETMMVENIRLKALLRRAYEALDGSDNGSISFHVFNPLYKELQKELT